MESLLQSIARETFTPVRRKEVTVNLGRLQTAQEQDWTTARCFRLLRALTSRVAILRKELSRNNTALQDSEEHQGKTSTKRKQPAEDADGARTRKKIRQTYSSKRKGCTHDENKLGRSQGTSFRSRVGSFVPGEVYVPTPILVRAIDERIIFAGPSGTNAEHKGKRCRPRRTQAQPEPNFYPTVNLCEPRFKPASSRCMTFEGIYNGLDALLRSTAKEASGSKNLGVKSLLSMCRRAIPQYILQQEGLLLDHMDANGGKSAIVSRDIAVEIYDELEAFGSSEKGWKGLRSVVLQHGLQIIGGAIRDGLMDVESCGLLVELCVTRSQLEGAEFLLGTALDSFKFPEPSTLYDSPDARLQLLWKYTQRTDRIAFQYRKLSRLLTNQALPVSWLATKAFGRFWTDLIRDFTNDPINLDSFDFLCAVIPLLVRAQGPVTGQNNAWIHDNSFTTAIQNTFSSLLTSILSICMLKKVTVVRGHPHLRRPPGFKHIILMLRSCLAEHDSSLAVPTFPYTLILLNVLAIASFEADIDLDLKSQMTGLLAKHLQRQRKDVFTAIATRGSCVQFLSNTARCCGRGASTSGFEFLQEFHLLLESLDTDCGTGDSLKGIIVDSAYLFSQSVPDHRHLDYATSLDTRFGVRAMVPDGSPEPERLGDTIGGFRWEEGLGEWVTTTPAVVHKRKVAEICPSTTEDRPDDSPYRPTAHLRKAIRNRTSLRASICARTEALEPSSGDIGDLFNGAERPEQSSAFESEDELAADLMTDEDSMRSNESMSETLFDEGSAASIPSSPWDTDHVRRERRRAFTGRAFRLSNWTPRRDMDCQLSDESSPSGTSTLCPDIEPSESSYRRRHRASTIRRKAPSSHQAWGTLESSDDELSFVITTSIVRGRVRASHTIDTSRICPVRSNNPAIRCKRVRIVDESEDELCF